MFNQEQVNELLKNKNVLRCSTKSITYSQEFKMKALMKHSEEGMGPNQIFEEAGFLRAWLGKYRAGNCLKKWRNKYKTEGQEALLKENRGAPGKRKKWTTPKNEKERIEYLETKIAYLEAENDFLAKLRGLKRK
jgi:transposase